jgi:7,8-dihydropterin-6-yl-methyl-4-(beta-D-ribofuranosyl)aminobenzene 5'-phosphate synthase
MSDVGQSWKFADNARLLGVDLAQVEVVVISHHHYDHGGGLGRFFQENDHAKVYLRQSKDEAHVAEDLSGVIRTIGLDDALLQRHKDRVVMVEETVEILPGLHVITKIPDQYPKPSGDLRLKARIQGKLTTDPFNHELVTVLENEQGLVILTGCAHNGVLNMIRALREVFPTKPILAVVGGLHLHHEEESEVRMIGETLANWGIPKIITGHCTGDEAADTLQEILDDRLQRLYTGLVMDF